MTGPDPDTKDTQANIAIDYPMLTIDWETYGAMLAESDLSEEDQIEVIQTLWSIVVAFVDLGFGLHPAQQCCGEEEDCAAADAGNVLHSDQHSQSKTTAKAAPSFKGAAAKTRRSS